MLPISPHAAPIQSSMHNTHFCFFASFAVVLFLSPLQAWGQTENDTLAHFMCVWPEADSLLVWDIERAEFSADCEHFMTEAQTSAPHENCNHLVAYRNANFMHVHAVDYGVYVFLGSDVETNTVQYTGIVRLGEDALEDWPGQFAGDSLPVLNMNWTWTRELYYSFCE